MFTSKKVLVSKFINFNDFYSHRQGRAALVTSYGIFKYMACYSLTQFVSVSILYYVSNLITPTMSCVLSFVKKKVKSNERGSKTNQCKSVKWKVSHYTPAPMDRGGMLFYPWVFVFPLHIFSSKIFKILTRSLLRHAIWWDSCLNKSDVNFVKWRLVFF